MVLPDCSCANGMTFDIHWDEEALANTWCGYIDLRDVGCNPVEGYELFQFHLHCGLTSFFYSGGDNGYNPLHTINCSAGGGVGASVLVCDPFYAEFDILGGLNNVDGCTMSGAGKIYIYA